MPGSANSLWWRRRRKRSTTSSGSCCLLRCSSLRSADAPWAGASPTAATVTTVSLTTSLGGVEVGRAILSTTAAQTVFARSRQGEWPVTASMAGLAGRARRLIAKELLLATTGVSANSNKGNLHANASKGTLALGASSLSVSTEVAQLQGTPCSGATATADATGTRSTPRLAPVTRTTPQQTAVFRFARTWVTVVTVESALLEMMDSRLPVFAMTVGPELPVRSPTTPNSQLWGGCWEFLVSSFSL
mmetsp:Transcript_9494/g.17990  ORF Transcript_9494/g.17990 Transcript_9494/m.17990 type:complete len:246 (+) Transcript_9494:209-946(+)